MSEDAGENNAESTPTLVRLQKYLASAGVGSRRSCEEFILAHRVTVDGKTAHKLGTCIDPARQKVRLDGELVRTEPKRYYLVNKPVGYVCTNRDPAGRPRVIDLVSPQKHRLFTVGRLDEHSRGLILITNDGELSNRLAHPRYGVERRYQVQVVGRPTNETLDQLKKGMHFADGKYRIKGIRRLKAKGKSTFLELVLTEGQNREIRRLLAKVGHKVISLQRVGFGPLRLGRLAEGKFRPLRTKELKDLRNLLEKHSKPESRSGKRKKRTPKRSRATRSHASRSSRSRS